MQFPTDRLQSTFNSLKYYSCARFITQIIPEADSIIIHDEITSEYHIKGGQKTLFEYSCEPNDKSFFFAWDLQNLIDEHQKSGRYPFYERALRAAQLKYMERYSLPSWAAVETFFDACVFLAPEESSVDLSYLASHDRLSAEEKLTADILRKIYVAPFPEIENIEEWGNGALRPELD